MENVKFLPHKVYQAGQDCKNNQWNWHKVDGYCKECCPDYDEHDEVIEDRRNSKGYR